MKVYKKVIILIFVLVIMITAGCAENPVLINSSVAALGTDCYISVNKDGTINAVDKAGEFGSDFSNWRDIKSVSASQFYYSGLKEDGSVVMTSYPGFEDISGWKNIKMLGFTLLSVYGLKEDGTIIYSSPKGLKEDDEIMAKVKIWTNIGYIDADFFGIVGVKKSGRVAAALFNCPELEEEVAFWQDIKTASISTGLGRARIIGVKHNGDFVEARSDDMDRYKLDSYDDLKGAVKICAGNTYTAGLMIDGTLRVICGGDYDILAKHQEEGADYIDIKPFDKMKDVADINRCDDLLVVLKKDGSVLVGGFLDND